MTEIEKVILTSLLTVLGGIIAFVFGQVMIKFIVEPIHDLRQLFGEITYSLIYYANVTPAILHQYREELKQLNLDDETKQQLKTLIEQEITWLEEAKKVFRKQASDLLAKASAVRLYWLWGLLGWLPKYENVISASSQLIGLSNSVYRDLVTEDDRAETIAKKLNIKILKKHFGV